MRVENILLLLGMGLSITLSSDLDIDPNGYILYCPCMGRFGNQAEHFLGSLGFAKSLNRTLVLPPWVEYYFPNPRSVQVPFDTYFKVEPLREYVRVMTMETFMTDLAPDIWPPGKRIVICYQARTGGNKNDCNAKEGNPFGPFWDTFNIDFDESQFYSSLHYDLSGTREVQRWKERFPSDKYPVLAFAGAPASFPVRERHIPLHRYLQWSQAIEDQVQNVLKEEIGVQPFVGIHLRLGSDFKNACGHIDQSPMMFGAAQCVGHRGQYGKTSYEMCYPSDDVIVEQVKKTVKKLGAKAVYIATDSRDLIKEMKHAMKKVKFVLGHSDKPHLDLAVLAASDHYIGNCISTFSGFVKRERDVAGKPSTFWAFKPSVNHEEL